MPACDSGSWTMMVYTNGVNFKLMVIMPPEPFDEELTVEIRALIKYKIATIILEGVPMRGLSNTFIIDLKTGKLNPFLIAVKDDDKLNLEIRNNYINIYYRGGNLLRITSAGKAGYRFHFDSKYCDMAEDKTNSEHIKSLDQFNAELWFNNLKLLKSEMDHWFSKHQKAEREFQHNLIKDNDGTNSDILILDIEYAGCTKERKLFRLDMLGISKVEKDYRLIIFENKYGGGAIGGKAGIKKHYNDIVSILDHDPSKEEMISSVINIINNKTDLGFLDIRLDKANIESIEILFLFAEFNSKSMAVKNTVLGIEKSIPAKLIFMNKSDTVIEYAKAKDLWEYEN